jgi:hypothetical protein
MVAFLALAVGQALGSTLFGPLMELVSSDAAVLAFASLAMAAGLIRRQPRG